MKPIIGVLPLWDDEKESLWMLPGYFNGILRAGGVPVMLPLSSDSSVIEQAIQMCDGFLFTGGHDVSPELYGALRKYVRRHIAGGANRTLISVITPFRLCRIGTCRRLSSG